VNLAVALAGQGNATVLVCPADPAALGLALVRNPEPGPPSDVAVDTWPGGGAADRESQAGDAGPATAVDAVNASAAADADAAGTAGNGRGDLGDGDLDMGQAGELPVPAVTLYPVIGLDTLSVMSMSQRPPAHLLTRPWETELLEQVEKAGGAGAHLVVLSGPALTSAAALEWARQVDGTVLCVRVHETQAPDLEAAGERLAVMGVPVLGMVIT